MDEKINRILNDFNPWWREPSALPSEVPPFHRHIFGYLRAWLDLLRKPRGILLEGPRQVGKSTILKQLIQSLGASGNVLYVSFDHPQISDVPLGDWLTEWLNTRNKPDIKYLFLDEITALEHWDRWLKHYLDAREDVRIIATSSHASLLRDKSRETGPGRWDEIWIPTFTFGEILEWRRKNLSISLSVPWTLIPPPSRGDEGTSEIRPVLDEYLRKGGFPAVWEEKDIGTAYDRLKRDGIDRALFKDLTILYQIRNPRLLERLFYRLALDTAHIVAIERVAKELKCGQATVEKNLGLLNESGLVQSLKLYPGTSRRGIGGSPKIILADPALLCAAFSGAGTFVVDEEMEGRLLESVVGAHLASFVKLKKGNLTYWRRGKHEVDFVLEIGNETIPIQVTRSKNIDPADMIGFAMFSQQHRKKATTGLLLYMGQETDRMVGTRKPMVVSCRNLALYLRHISQGIISYS